MQGLHRVRFFAQSPDGRIFVTDMHDLGDNTVGVIYILAGFNAKTGKLRRRQRLPRHLHNPNNVAFYTDPTGQSWLYFHSPTALSATNTAPATTRPNGPPRSPRRTIPPTASATSTAAGISPAPSPSAAARRDASSTSPSAAPATPAIEKEEVRATLSVMDPDGNNAHIVATSLRNAVGLRLHSADRWRSALRHQHGRRPPRRPRTRDTFFELDSNKIPGPFYERELQLQQADEYMKEGHGFSIMIPPPPNYGWPTCYFSHGVAVADHLISDPQPTDVINPKPPAGPPPPQFDCSQVPAAYSTFAAHASPLGFDYFGDDAPAALRDSFLVALHGASWQQLWATRGYRLVRISTATRQPEDFLTGFVANGKVLGRPCGILRIAPNAFLLTDDMTASSTTSTPSSSVICHSGAAGNLLLPAQLSAIQLN